MQVRISPTLTANPILTLEDLGLERSVGLDQASRGLAERSEAQIVRWVQFPAGALFFTLVPEDPESGAVYVFDRRNGAEHGTAFIADNVSLIPANDAVQAAAGQSVQGRVQATTPYI